MAADAGMSIKERLAMLQSNNKNPALAGPLLAQPAVAQKTTLSVNKAPPSDPSDKANGPSTPGRPLGALKPVIKTAVNDAGDTKEYKPQLGFRLKPTGVQLDGKGVAPVVPIKPRASDTGGTGVATPAVPNKPEDSHPTAPLVPKKPDGASHEPAITASITILRDKSNATNTPRPPSLQERMAALRSKAGDDGAEVKSGSSGLKSPDASQKKVPVFPYQAGAGGLRKDTSSVNPSDLAKGIREAAVRIRDGKKASDTFLRYSDGKRFHKIDVSSVVSSGPAPAKPPVINDVDLATFLQEYATAKETKLSADAAKDGAPDAVDGEMEELYVEAESTTVALRVRGKGSVKRATSVRVSEIPEFTEEEEDKEVQEDRQSGAVANIAEEPEEDYDDCASAAASVQNQQQLELEESEEIYEPLDDDLGSPEPEPAPSPGPVDDKKAKKKEKEEKGAKKKDKVKEEASKKEERERKKKEEEVKKQRKKFKLKDTDEKVGEGLVKNNAAGGGMLAKDQLPVTRGEMLAILRMDNNPAGKWLVQNDQGKLGYVSSNNIEVATPSIRQMMSGAAAALPGDDEDPEELYEALPEGEMDEIYEEL